MSQLFKLKTKNENFEVNLNKLDDSQRAAVEATGENIVIRAAAGSGKTSTLITAIAAYRYENINDRICAITYTRAARAEMEERLKTLGIYDVEVTTIHVWARNLLEKFAKRYDFKVRILEEYDIKAILEELVQIYYRKRGRKTKINIGILYSYITGNKTMEITDAYRRVLNFLEEQYIQYKRDNVLYDFTDYPLYLYDIMITYDEFVCDIDALFVDEFQDVDEVQFDTFNRVLARKKIFIGDPWQSIFQFRNADGEVFNKLENFQLYKLKYNYRSYQEIIDYAATVFSELVDKVDSSDLYITQIKYSKPCNIKCVKGYGGAVSIIDPFGNFMYNNKSMGQIEVDQNFMLRQFRKLIDKNAIILCRTNKQVKAIQELGYPNVSTIHQAKGLEYDDVIVIDSPIRNSEDLNIAYVALTRARNNLMVLPWSMFISFWEYQKKKSNLIDKINDLI